MKRLRVSENKEQWPRQAVKAVECRRRDLVIRIADWTKQSSKTGEPGFDVECYIGGVYDWNESRTFTLREHSKEQAKTCAVEFAVRQVKRLL